MEQSYVNLKEIHQLVQLTQRKNFPRQVYRQDYLLSYDLKLGSVIDKPSLLQNLMPIRSRYADYHISKLDRPLVVQNLHFKWHEGTSLIDLDLNAHLEVIVKNSVEAKALVAALAGRDPIEFFSAKIDAVLKARLSDIFNEYHQQNKDFLGFFVNKNAIPGVSAQLDQLISKDLCHLTGLSHFRIGFQVDNLPPLQVQLERTTALKFTDSTANARYQVKTSALLELENYQLCRHTGFTQNDQIVQHMNDAIDHVIRSRLFSGKFYQIISQFRNSDESAQAEIQRSIGEKAKSIGYKLTLIQTLADIPALQLYDGVRVEFSARDHQFKPSFSSSEVGINLSVEFSVLDDHKIRNLIRPEDQDIHGKLMSKLVEICHDQIAAISKADFNLHFASNNDMHSSGLANPSVSQRLTQAIVQTFQGDFGLAVNITRLSQEETVEAKRFNQICGRSIAFNIAITPRGLGMQIDPIEASGRFEVAGMSEQGWDTFEKIKPSITLTTTHPEYTSSDLNSSTLSDEQWAHYTLEDIKKLVQENLESHFSGHEKLVEYAHSKLSEAEFKQLAESVVNQAIIKSHGLLIKLTAFNRQDTHTERTSQEIRHIKLNKLTELSKAQQALEIERLQINFQSITDLELRRKDLLETLDPSDKDAVKEIKGIEKQIEDLSQQSNRRIGGISHDLYRALSPPKPADSP